MYLFLIFWYTNFDFLMYFHYSLIPESHFFLMCLGVKVNQLRVKNTHVKISTTSFEKIILILQLKNGGNKQYWYQHRKYLNNVQIKRTVQIIIHNIVCYRLLPATCKIWVMRTNIYQCYCSAHVLWYLDALELRSQLLIKG